MLTHPRETITWIDADDRLPLAGEKTVLLFVPGHTEPVWPGFYDDEEGEWRFCNGAGLDHPVIAWAEMPVGPTQNESKEDE